MSYRYLTTQIIPGFWSGWGICARVVDNPDRRPTRSGRAPPRGRTGLPTVLTYGNGDVQLRHAPLCGTGSTRGG